MLQGIVGILVVTVIWVGGGIAINRLARSQGRNPVPWNLVGLIAPLFPLIALVIIGSSADQDERSASPAVAAALPRIRSNSSRSQRQEKVPMYEYCQIEGRQYSRGLFFLREVLEATAVCP